MISDYLAEKLVNHSLGLSSFTMPSGVWVAFFTSPIRHFDALGSLTEVSGGSYARTSVTMALWDKGMSINSAKVTMPAPTADWGRVKSMALVDNGTSGGNWLYGANVCPFNINNGDAAYELDIATITAWLGEGKKGCC